MNGRRQSDDTRLHYGTEFCEHLLPTPDALSRSYLEAKEEGLGFTFVTPWVTSQGLDRIRPLFAFLSEKDPRAEVVVNDWGVLRLLRRNYGGLIPVAGRLIHKTLKDPRVPPHEGSPVPYQSSLSSPYYQRLLASFGIRRIEIDSSRRNADIDFASLGLEPSIYVPWEFVTTGRVCFFGSLNAPKRDKFEAHTPCRRECLTFFADLTDPEVVATGGTTDLMLRGNTVFYKQETDRIEKALLWAAARQARVVYQRSHFGEMAYSTENLDVARDWIMDRQLMPRVGTNGG